ncbi:MAG: ABC transporter permease, partial [Desulfurococcales archaeon]|nr:ABC transporter permease [Desulfurococcales archaeon]
MGSGWRILSQAYVGVKGLFRNKGAVFWVIIFPILFYGLMVAIWGSPSYQPVKTGIVNLDPQQGDAGISASLIAAMNKSKLFKIKVYSTTTQMLQDLRHGKISAGLLIPVNFSDNLESMRTAVVTVYYT